MSMDENQEAEALPKDKKKVMEQLLLMIKPYPQVFQGGIGAELFMEILIKGCKKYEQLTDDEIFAMEEISKIIIDYPQIVRPGTGVEVFLEELHKATIKYSEYFSKPG